MSFRILATIKLLASCTVALSLSKDGMSSAGLNVARDTIADASDYTVGLAEYATAAGKYFGTAVDFLFTKELQDAYYMAELNNTRDFNQLTPGNAMKWAYTEPEQNVFDYTASDQFVAIARANNQIVRCHNLAWYNQNPDWLTNGFWTNDTILAALENHISNLVAHFGDDCYHWDVVNEAFNEDGTYRQNIWYNVTGTEYIYTAFAAAEAAVAQNNLSTKLYYNDYNIETAGAKSTAAQELVSSIKARGIQIDGVGLQSHFIIGSTPSTSDQIANMNAFIALGVEVAITELDIRTTLPATIILEQQQSLDYMSTISACSQVDQCVGVTIWDFDDTYSWIPGTFSGQGYADIFSQSGGAGTPLEKKAAYDGIIAGWNVTLPAAEPDPVTSTSATAETASTTSMSSTSSGSAAVSNVSGSSSMTASATTAAASITATGTSAGARTRPESLHVALIMVLGLTTLTLYL